MSRAPDIYVNTGFELFEEKNRERGNPPNPRTVIENHNGHYAFSYAKTHAVGVDKNQNGKYVSVIREKDLEDAKELAINKEKLRNEMTSLGKEVANELTVNLYKVKT
jgi:hypothetical protein